jgi:hypothetical protein
MQLAGSYSISARWGSVEDRGGHVLCGTEAVRMVVEAERAEGLVGAIVGNPTRTRQAEGRRSML